MPNLIDNLFTRTQDFITGHTRHLFASQSLKNNIEQRPKENISQAANRLAQKRKGKPALRINEAINKASNKTNLLLSGSKSGQSLQKLFRNKWAKKGVFAAGSMVAFSLVGKAMSGFMPSPAIPSDYERGYDLINESMTDFGSPIKLNKTASKIITPYHSTVRKGFRTSVRTTTERNPALFAHSHAINHTKY